MSLFPSLGTCHQVRIPELDGVRVIEAKFDEGVLMVVLNAISEKPMTHLIR